MLSCSVYTVIIVFLIFNVSRDAPNAVWHQMHHVRDVTYHRISEL